MRCGCGLKNAQAKRMVPGAFRLRTVMIVDIHCHVGFSARRVDPALPRFAFEPRGAAGRPGYDSYFSPRVLKKWGALTRWDFVRRAMGVDMHHGASEELDRQIQAFNDRHMLATSADRLVLLAFDEYHSDHGTPVGLPIAPSPEALWFASSAKRLRSGHRSFFVADGRSRLKDVGTDLYVSNTLARSLCAARPDKFLFGASVHPYRPGALAALDELKAAGAVLIKWLPIHQNIRAGDARTVAFLRHAAELKLALLIHYGGEMTLARQHMEFESPAELIDVLRDLRAERRMPTTIVAHAATPSVRFQSAASHRLLVDALLGEFRDAPLYADISALAAMGRAPWLPRLAKRRELHAKLVWGTDFPVPMFPLLYWRRLGMGLFDIGRIASWIERDLQLKRAIGFDEGVFHRAGEILDLPRPPAG